MTSEILDPLGRVPISDGIKRRIADAFTIVPADHTVAAIVLVDSGTKNARLHWATRVNEPDGKWGEFKVAGGLGVPWDGKKPDGWVGVIWSK